MTGRERDEAPTIPPHTSPTRDMVFARDGWCCVYCGTEGTPETLSVDHVQPRVRGGDHTAGNVVTACLTCNALKGHRRHTEFLTSDPALWRNFSARAQYVWPRLLEAVEQALELKARRGTSRRSERSGQPPG